MGESLASILEGILMKYNISDRILAIIIDNASNNNTLTKYLQYVLGRLRTGSGWVGFRVFA